LKDLLLNFFKTNHDLLDYTRRSAHLQSVQNRRAAIKVAVIDDDPFLPQTKLQSYGYNLTAIGDIKRVSEVKDYDVILCDIIGVGQHFDSKVQGASLIAEIKSEYPEKVVVAYTGGTPTDQAQKIVVQKADAVISKDIDNQEWVTKLDEIAFKAVDPHEIWNKVRERFVNLDVDTKTILMLEDAYVRSILGRDRSLAMLSRAASSANVTGDVRAIITGLVSNAIFKLIVG
jgi:CheY-like chemotaxis protein